MGRFDSNAMTALKRLAFQVDGVRGVDSDRLRRAKLLANSEGS